MNKTQIDKIYWMSYASLKSMLNATTTTARKIWWLWLQPFRRYLRACKIVKLVTLPWPRPF